MQDPKELVRDVIAFLGDDPSRPGLIDTPDRVVRAWKTFSRGYAPVHEPLLTLFPNNDPFPSHNLIIDRGYFFSICEHHLLPFFGNYYFGYIPDKWLIGASKVARVVDYFSSRLQVAERLVNQIVDFLSKRLQPMGLILVMDGRHLCKEMRGVKKVDSWFEVVAVDGVFFSNEKGCKEEFLLRVGKPVH